MWQVPSGWFAAKFGGKDILTVNMAANAVLLFALPAAARLGTAWVYANFIVMGMFQGPLIPAQGAIKVSPIQT